MTGSTATLNAVNTRVNVVSISLIHPLAGVTCTTIMIMTMTMTMRSNELCECGVAETALVGEGVGGLRQSSREHTLQTITTRKEEVQERTVHEKTKEQYMKYRKRILLRSIKSHTHANTQI